ncbi:MAG: nickel pincer cofactor biosynthesis protein LarB [Blautia sp.]|nr:nickel pincer cofactor biosynthesis protein LarB [Blautia sp.]
MKKEELEQILCRVQSGEMKIEEAVSAIKLAPFRDLGYAKVDTQRELRQGTAEVIYGEGKSAGQIRGIVQAMRREGQETILITRLSGEKADALKELPLTYYREARIGVVGVMPEPEGDGKIVVATGGTSDLRVAEEAALTAETFGNRVVRLYDVGVAGIHRLLANAELLMEAGAVIVVAGMEGALASVVGGLVDCPVIAVPTSVGYGVAAGGYAALLSMLSSCASGVSVVNIDNGYGAGYLASMINRRTQRR